MLILVFIFQGKDEEFLFLQFFRNPNSYLRRQMKIKKSSKGCFTSKYHLNCCQFFLFFVFNHDLFLFPYFSLLVSVNLRNPMFSLICERRHKKSRLKGPKLGIMGLGYIQYLEHLKAQMCA